MYIFLPRSCRLLVNFDVLASKQTKRQPIKAQRISRVPGVDSREHSQSASKRADPLRSTASEQKKKFGWLLNDIQLAITYGYVPLTRWIRQVGKPAKARMVHDTAKVNPGCPEPSCAASITRVDHVQLLERKFVMERCVFYRDGELAVGQDQ